jgi:molybdopterin converting factor subunit 1
MRCEVLLFAQLREAVGRDRLTIEMPDAATVAVLVDALCREHGAIAALRGRVAVAVDETYRPMSFTLGHGSTVALIPPVSGG